VNKKKRQEEEEKRQANEERNAKSQKKPYPKPKLYMNKFHNPIVSQPITQANVCEHLSNAQLDKVYGFAAVLEKVIACFPHPNVKSCEMCLAAKQGSGNKIKRVLLTVRGSVLLSKVIRLSLMLDIGLPPR
jgi:hypothetical protein